MHRVVSGKVLKFWDYGCWLRRGARAPAFADFDLMDIHDRIGGVVDYALNFSYERLVYPLADADGAIRHLTAVLVSQPAEATADGISYHQLPWPE